MFTLCSEREAEGGGIWSAPGLSGKCPATSYDQQVHFWLSLFRTETPSPSDLGYIRSLFALPGLQKIMNKLCRA